MRTCRSALILVGVAAALLFSQSGCVSSRTQEAVLRDVNGHQPEPVIVSGLEQVWSVGIGSNRLAGAITSDPIQGKLYALVPDFERKQWKRCVQISADGKLEREFTNKKYATSLRTGHLRSRESRDLVLHCGWGGPMAAADTNGKTLWTYDRFWGGLCDLWVADLDGDGLDEMIIAYSGFSGLHVLNGRGKRIWKRGLRGNVWSACSADLDGDGKSEVIATSQASRIHVFKSDGTRLSVLEPPPGYYANQVRPLKLSDSARAQGILVTGGKGRVAALKGDGTLAWEAPFDTAPAGDDVEPARGKPWLALIARSVVVLDTRTGSTIAELKAAGKRHLCWLEVKGQSSPLLIVSTRQRIYAYRVIGDK